MLFHRELLKDIEKAIIRKEIIALVGARQIGKTTILNYLYEKIKNEKSSFISFNDLEILNLFEKNTPLFIEKYVEDKDYLFIDEIQYSKDSGRILKLIYDSSKIKIFISGSSKSEIAIKSLSYLVGRVFIFNLYPLDLLEILKSFNKNSFLFDKLRTNNDFDLIKNDFISYLEFGGYPEVILEKDTNVKVQILKNIKNTYLLKEIKDVLGYRDTSNFENILKFLAINDGKILNKTSISNGFGIHNNKVKEIIDVLEKTSILNILKPFMKNKSKELIKSPKTYFFDLGFKNSILNNFNSPDSRGDKGEIYENFILNALVKSGFEVNYWNYKNLYEMDFVVNSERGLFGFEVKSKLKDSSLSNSVKRFIDENKPNKVFVFCENIEDNKNYQNCEIIFTNYLNIFFIRESLR